MSPYGNVTFHRWKILNAILHIWNISHFAIIRGTTWSNKKCHHCPIRRAGDVIIAQSGDKVTSSSLNWVIDKSTWSLGQIEHSMWTSFALFYRCVALTVRWQLQTTTSATAHIPRLLSYQVLVVAFLQLVKLVQPLCACSYMVLLSSSCSLIVWIKHIDICCWLCVFLCTCNFSVCDWH